MVLVTEAGGTRAPVESTCCCASSRASGRRHPWLPLLPETGEAVLMYLGTSRPKTAVREVFIRCNAPSLPALPVRSCSALGCRSGPSWIEARESNQVRSRTLAAISRCTPFGRCRPARTIPFCRSRLGFVNWRRSNQNSRFGQVAGMVHRGWASQISGAKYCGPRFCRADFQFRNQSVPVGY